MTEEQPFGYQEREGKAEKRGCLITFGAWLFSFLWLGWLRKMMYPDSQGPEWVNTTAVLVLIAIAPVIGIFQAISLKDHLDWHGKKSVFTILWRVLIIFGCWLAALVVTVTGLFSMLGILQHWENEGRTGATLPMMALCLAIVALGLYLFWMPFKRPSGSGVAAYERREMAAMHARRLVSPDFAGIEEQAGVKLPALYQSLFALDSEWMAGGWLLLPEGEDGASYQVTELVPAHPDALRTSASLPGTFLAFATGEDFEYWIQLGPEDPPVFTHALEEEEEEPDARICDHLSSFLQWPKEDWFG